MLVAGVLLSCIAFVTYWRDKRAALADTRRVPEAVLHLLDLFGGIAGGLLAQQVFRHKTRKTGFAIVSALIWLLHTGGLALLVLRAI